MKAYKGFNKDMTCNGFQYKEGETFVFDGDAKLCERGFHACTNPIDVLHYYYPAGGSRYFEVECEGVAAGRVDDSKIACSQITIGAELGLLSMIKIGVQMIFDRVNRSKFDKNTSGYQSTAATSGDLSTAATSGDRSTAATSGCQSTAATGGDGSTAATSGDQSTAATSGYQSTAATSGDRSTAATSGYQSTAATSGFRSTAATSGYLSIAASSGNQSIAASSGYLSAAETSGYQSIAASSGNQSIAITKGCESIAVANGYGAKAKGALGCYIVLAEYDDNSNLVCVRCHKVDGKTIKPDTFYMLKNKKFVEVKG